MKKIIMFLLIFNAYNLYAQHCWPATSSIDLDVNNIRAKLLNGGDMWWDGGSLPAYEYPKVDTSVGILPNNLIFGGALWMTALDSLGDLKCAAQTYRNQGHDFWPGPLEYGQNIIQDTTCTNFDRFFPILRTELTTHIGNVNLSSGPLSLSSIPANVLQWPGKGNQYLASTYGINIVNELAPFEDCNGNDIYDPENGDYPLMKGDQSIFWVINDLGNTHTRSGGDPLGVEIQCMAYAFITNDAVNDATFYDYKVLKKTSGNLSDFYFSQFADPDIAGFASNYIGCDTILDYGFCYTPISGGYRGTPPILMMQFLKTPSDKGLTSFLGIDNCGSGPQCDPDDAPGFRNFQLGNWGDGTKPSCTHNGVTVEYDFIYPGNPALPSTTNSFCNNDSECSAGNQIGDRRFLLNSGPYELKTNIPLEFTIAVMVTENSIPYSACPDKNTLINPVVNLVDSFIANVEANPYSCKVLSSIVDFEDKNNEVLIYPNPARDYISIEVSEHLQIENIEIYDVLGSKVDVVLEGNRIDVRLLSKGVYSLKVSNAEQNKVIVKKFLVD